VHPAIPEDRLDPTTRDLVAAAGLLAAGAVRLPYALRYRPAHVTGHRRSLADAALVVAVTAGMLAPLADLTPFVNFADYTAPAWSAWLGAGLFIAALAVLWRSHADLGPNWSPTPEIRTGHILVTTGVYRLVRHPMYAAVAMWAAAQLLLVPNWLAGPALLAAFLPFYLVRVPAEELLMLDRFGDAYRDYAARTGRLLPWPSSGRACADRVS
jgi:protein-S-isoprenylcysteine O-methyltransferase Ste14